MIGRKLAHYEITSHLGTGGMGEVYQATDTKLGRSVAIKLLPAAFASDPDRLSRFRREAQLLASLNHPNIAHIYGLEESGDTRCIVLELIEGETLQARIKKGPIPVDEALVIAKQIAEALEAAHEKGVIHRDLKPGNVMLTADGRVKVLDFGLAKAYDANPGSATSSNSPTMASMAATNAAVILGTAAYMAPEQARGKTVDKRADVWAFGVVLFEMLTGQRAFPGEDLTDTLGSVVKLDPKWEALGTDVSSRVRQVLRVCLQKDPRQRAQAIGDVRLALEGAFETSAPESAPTSSSSRGRRWMAALAFGLSVIFALAIPAVRHLLESSPPEMRLEIVAPFGASLTDFAISPDGRKVVFQVTAAGKSSLWLRLLDSEISQPLTATENGERPFWSPDSRSIGFTAGAQLRKLDISSGALQNLASASQAYGGTWNRKGIILFNPSTSSPLYRVLAQGGGGEPVEVTRVQPPNQIGHRFPQFLPDGRQFLFFLRGTLEVQGVYIGALDSTENRRLFAADAPPAVFVPPDYLLFARQGVLMAQQLNISTAKPIGDPVAVAGRVAVDTLGPYTAISASAAGPIAYRANAEEMQLIWLDREGRPIKTLGEPDRAQPFNPRLSPDGSTVALTRTIDGNADVWLIDTNRGTSRRLTTNAARDFFGAWSHDGSHVVFGSDRKGVLDLYESTVSSPSTEAPLLESSESKNIYDWSTDDRFILYATQTQKAGRDLWALPLFGDKKPVPVAVTAFEEAAGRFSPDAHWVAYQSNETGRNEVYVQQFPKSGTKVQISTNGGTNPQWRHDGREIFYSTRDNRLIAVAITLSDGGIKVGASAELFPLPGSGYFASPDGQRFLINKITKEASPITILLNWKPTTK